VKEKVSHLKSNMQACFVESTNKITKLREGIEKSLGLHHVRMVDVPVIVILAIAHMVAPPKINTIIFLTLNFCLKMKLLCHPTCHMF